MLFAVPMVWREQKDNSFDCYFYLTNISGFSLKSKHSIQYPNLPSALRPISHGQDLPIPTPPKVYSVDDDVIDKDDAYMEDISDPDFQPTSSTAPHLISQEELNDLVRDLTLSKSQAELLGSRLQGWNLLTSDTNISIYCNREKT